MFTENLCSRSKIFYSFSTSHKLVTAPLQKTSGEANGFIRSSSSLSISRQFLNWQIDQIETISVTRVDLDISSALSPATTSKPRSYIQMTDFALVSRKSRRPGIWAPTSSISLFVAEISKIYFHRITNPRKTKPEELQVLVDIIIRAGWNYVSVVNTEGDKTSILLIF